MEKTVAGMAVGTHAALMASYKSVQGKTKKRFMRKPNMADSVDQYMALSKWLEKEGAHRYGAFVALAAARCDQAMSNPTGQADKIVKAGQLYAQSQIESGTLDFAGFEEDLAEAIDCYELAVSIYIRIHRTAFAATLRSELANGLVVFGKLGEAATNYRASAELLAGSPLPCIGALSSATDCKIRQEDHDGALALCVEVMGVVAAHARAVDEADDSADHWDYQSPGDHFGHYGALFGKGVYADVIQQAEITSVLLLLLLPELPREAHAFAKTLDFYRDVDATRPETRYMNADMFLMLQSAVLAVENGDLDALRELQSTLWFSMTSVQNELCNRLVETLVG